MPNLRFKLLYLPGNLGYHVAVPLIGYKHKLLIINDMAVIFRASAFLPPPRLLLHTSS